jgi:D-3-phosphoglycerate dehydrogenase
MYTIKTLNKISPTGLAQLDPGEFVVDDAAENPDGILVRSAKMHDYDFPSNLRAIARAGAGTNNIPLDRCAEAGIVVFNTPGANANAVKELVIGALILSCRDLMKGSQWVRQQAEDPSVDVAAAVEKGKSAFVGPEITGKTLAVIGLGAIGVLVANACVELGMNVVGYDPFLSVNSALRLSPLVRVESSVEALVANADFVTIHVPYNKDTANTICAETIGHMKDGVRILNLARGELVNDDDMIAALESDKVACYVTDFPNNKITLAKNVLAMPHLGASTPESEENCAVMAAQELSEYLLTGNIRNSVNLPSVEMARSGEFRMGIIHRNVPNMLSNLLSILSAEGANIENMTNKSRGDYAYSLIDFGSAIPEKALEEVRNVDGVLRVRVLKY